MIYPKSTKIKFANKIEWAHALPWVQGGKTDFKSIGKVCLTKTQGSSKNNAKNAKQIQND